jgi:hypothetical protein
MDRPLKREVLIIRVILLPPHSGQAATKLSSGTRRVMISTNFLQLWQAYS